MSSSTSSSEYCCVVDVSLLLVLQDNFSHAEVEHGADVDNQKKGADNGKSQY